MPLSRGVACAIVREVVAGEAHTALLRLKEQAANSSLVLFYMKWLRGNSRKMGRRSSRSRSRSRSRSKRSSNCSSRSRSMMAKLNTSMRSMNGSKSLHLSTMNKTMAQSSSGGGSRWL